MILYALSVFISAYLLFQVQPMIGKYILPWFGGSPAVWSTVLVFFQVLLTGGYAYSNWLITHHRPKQQLLLHAGLLGISILALAISGSYWPSPIMPGSGWTVFASTFPILTIFVILTIALGLPYFLLSTNSPLMQAWFNRAFPGRSPYWLYALSNGGSLLGLLAYPILVEPNLKLFLQGWLWTAGYVIFVALVLASALGSLRGPMSDEDYIKKQSTNLVTPIAPHRRLMWIILSALASLMLLAVTNALTQDIAAIPFLWILPLAVYLLSFILAFSGERWYSRRLFSVLLFLSSGIFFWSLYDKNLPTLVPVLACTFLLFVICMICNGELYRLRPEPAQLTSFYLMVSCGGALGGLFVDLLAPAIFTNYWELYLGLFLVWRLVIAFHQKPSNENPDVKEKRVSLLLLRIGLVLLLAFAIIPRLGRFAGIPFVQRNFFGVISVRDIGAEDPAYHRYILSHGITIHGLQFTAAPQRDKPTTYYTPQSGGAIAITSYRGYGHGMRVGLLGEGIGTLAAYARPGDVYRFYEINPVVAELASGQGGFFSFLTDSQAKIQVVLGDARLSLEQELLKNGSQNFDVLVLDTFSSDAIPVHLLTAEAFSLYLEHLGKGGIIAAHISNKHLNLLPVLCRLAQNDKLQMVVIDSGGDGISTFDAQWVLLSKDASSLSNPVIQEHADLSNVCDDNTPLWTDEYSNLFQILK